jgi:CheY-like chemotaxis protein
MENKPLSILVVEDEELLLDIIERKLTEAGIKIVCSMSGEDALNKLQNFTPDAIWLDYHLRGMDGLDFVERVKKDSKFANIPVIVVSNSANDDTMNKLLKAGAAKYLLKAQNRLDDIIREIRSLVK